MIYILFILLSLFYIPPHTIMYDEVYPMDTMDTEEKLLFYKPFRPLLVTNKYTCI